MATTLGTLKTAARQKANMENSTFISDSELTDYINQSYAELYDIMVSRFEDYYSKTEGFSILSGSTSHTLPADMYKMRALDYTLDSKNFVTVRKFNFEDRNKISRNVSRTLRGFSDRAYRIMGQQMFIYPQDAAPGTYVMWYIPRYTPLALDADVLGDVMDFQEYITADAAIKMLAKEESDVSVLMAQKQALLARIEAMASNRDTTPERISDVSNYWTGDFLFPRS